MAEHSSDVIITSCCHSVNLLIRKYYPELIPYLSPVVSPMIAHSIDIKRRYPGANILPLDYDASVSTTNQLNRLKLLMATARA